MADSSDCGSDNGERKDKPTSSYITSFYSKMKIGKVSRWLPENLDFDSTCLLLPTWGHVLERIVNNDLLTIGQEQV